MVARSRVADFAAKAGDDIGHCTVHIRKRMRCKGIEIATDGMQTDRHLLYTDRGGLLTIES